MKNSDGSNRIAAHDITKFIGSDFVSSDLYEKISLLVMRLNLDMTPTEFIDTVLRAEIEARDSVE
jgi:hypothetical protein